MTTAFALITVNPKEEKNIGQKIREYPEITKLWEVYGEYDIVAKIDIDSTNELNRFMTEKLRKEEGIMKTSTLLAFE